MAKLTINGPIDGESLEFIQGILDDLQGHRWVKDAIKAGLAHDPGEAHDGAALIYKAMQMRVHEIDDDEN
jgi:hypothetical protein